MIQLLKNKLLFNIINRLKFTLKGFKSAGTMAERQKLIVYGYVRSNYNEQFINDIIDIIYKYYLITIASNILNEDEKRQFMNFLCDRLKQQIQYQLINDMNTELLYRASDHDFSIILICKKVVA